MLLLAAQMATSGLTSGSWGVFFSQKTNFLGGFRREMEGPWALGPYGALGAPWGALGEPWGALGPRGPRAPSGVLRALFS